MKSTESRWAGLVSRVVRYYTVQENRGTYLSALSILFWLRWVRSAAESSLALSGVLQVLSLAELSEVRWTSWWLTPDVEKVA